MTCICFAFDAYSQSIEARSQLGDLAELNGWTGLEKAPGLGPDGGDAARLGLSGVAEFLYQAEEGEGIGWEATKGRFRRYDPARDWWGWPVLALDVKLPEEVSSANLNFRLLTPGDRDQEVIRDVSLRVRGSGWSTVYVMIDDFRLNRAVTPGYLGYVRGLRVKADSMEDVVEGDLLLANLRLQRGRRIGLIAPVKSKPGDPGETIVYEVAVVNSSEERQAVTLRLDRDGGEVTITTVEPNHMDLEPGEVRTVTVQAAMATPGSPGVPGDLPKGGREHWRLQAIPNGRSDLAEEVELIHVMRMAPPYIVHSEDDWNKIRELAGTEAWAEEDAGRRIDQARRWQPNRLQTGINQVQQVWNAAVAWQLTREEVFAEKVAEFLRMLADPESGYPNSLDAADGGPGHMVGEGIYFRNAVRAYDAIRDAGLLTGEDEEKIATAFRIYLDYARRDADHVGNHPLSGVTGALYVAFALQDWEQVERVLEGPGGIHWQIRRGIMDDGWTVEVSTGYNMFCARMLTEAGLALRPWGVELLEARFPAVYHESAETSARPGVSAVAWRPAERLWPNGGMYAAAWGPSRRNYRQIRDMFDSVIPLINETGGIVGLNDSHGEDMGQSRSFNMAAYAYGDLEYKRLADGRDLLYPVDRSDVKEREENKLLPSARADNAGVALLRSQGANSPHEQYQSAIKYGSHGLHHGHWDRTQLVYLRRFGKLATHTRTAWTSYGNILYQMYVQTSMAQSMVIVDGKNQYPAASDRLLWYTGDLFQAVAVENKTRWSNPRFGGHMGYSEEDKERGYMMYGNQIRVEIPPNPPGIGEMTEFTELVRSRRLKAVTDDYVLVIDNVKGEEEHTFDLLYQFRGFRDFNGNADIEFIEEREKFDDSPLSAGQFVRDARIYEARGPVRATFVSGYEPGSINPQPMVEEGWDSMTIDVYTAWPEQRRHIVARNIHDWSTYSAARSEGREASFVTLIELQEDEANRRVHSVTAAGPNQVRVKLADGRVHNWRVSGLDAEERRPAIELKLVENRPDGGHREEKSE